MGRKLQSIYDYLCDYTIEEIDNMIFDLTIEEKLLIRDRYGNDLHHPKSSINWTKEKNIKFYNILVPKMRKLLATGIYKKPKEIVIEKDYNTLLTLLREEKTNEEICAKLNINNKQLARYLLELKSKGLMYYQKYYSNGSIIYKTTSNDNKEGINKRIIADVVENRIKMLVISDLHYGNEFERLDLVDRAFNYCAKNGINIILCLGDFIDGCYSKSKQKISDVHEQMEYFLNNYPSDKNILTFGVGGDHDLSALNKESLNIIEMCNSFRHDIVIGGFNNVIVYIKKDKLHLYHYINNGCVYNSYAPIVLHGHTHKFLVDERSDILNIAVPSLSQIIQTIPTALELSLSFNKGLIDDTIVKQIYFSEQDITLSEMHYNLLKERVLTSNQIIKNIDFFKSDLQEDNCLKRV